MERRRARVLFRDEAAGILEETPAGGTVFSYLDKWAETIACALPAGQRRFPWDAGLHPVFQNLGPEGWLRQRQARSGRIEQEDDLGLLLRYGRDCIGAISVVPDDPLHPPETPPGGTPADATIRSHRTVSGVQMKLLAWKDGDVFRPATDDSPATHIAKYAPESQPALVRNEFLSLGLARDVLGASEVTKAELGEVEGIPGLALLIERFDRTPDGRKLRMEDFAQILLRPRGNDFRGKYDGSYEEVTEAIGRHSARPQIDRARFFSALVFNLVIGNADAHLKNWSLLERPEGLRLSPQYDLVNTLHYGPVYESSTALALGDAHMTIDAVDRDVLLSFADRIGLPRRVASERLNALLRGFQQSRWIEPPRGEPPEGFVSRYREIVENACARLQER